MPLLTSIWNRDRRAFLPPPVLSFSQDGHVALQWNGREINDP